MRDQFRKPQNVNCANFFFQKYPCVKYAERTDKQFLCIKQKKINSAAFGYTITKTKGGI